MVCRLLSVWHFISTDFMVMVAWVMGAADPTSGTVSLLEIVRGFGVLLRKGWKPLRTGELFTRMAAQVQSLTITSAVIIASWDAEEVRCLLISVSASTNELF